MSSLYKRRGSPYYWWSTCYKGRRLRKSTRLSQKHLAKKVQAHWDLKLMMDDLSFLDTPFLAPTKVKDYVWQYLKFVERRKSEHWLLVIKGVLKRFLSYLKTKKIRYFEDVTVKSLDGYIDWLEYSSKTKKNHIGIISLMLDQAVREGVIKSNPAKFVTLPMIEKRIRHRLLEPVDLEIIFTNAGGWRLYYLFLLYTGLRAGDVGMLTFGNIDRKKNTIVSFIRKSRRITELPLAKVLIDQLPKGKSKDEAIFPQIHADTERKLNDNLLKPRSYMQTLLEVNGRQKATLHSFRVTFNNSLRDLGLTIGDRQVLLAHSSSETTKIYTHPNIELAREFIDRLPVFGKDKKRN